MSCNSGFFHVALLFCLRPLLAENPDIVVGTPSRILGHVQAGNLVLKDSVEMVVIDEADLVFSFGYEQDMRALLAYVWLTLFVSTVLSLSFVSLKVHQSEHPIMQALPLKS